MYHIIYYVDNFMQFLLLDIKSLSSNSKLVYLASLLFLATRHAIVCLVLYIVIKLTSIQMYMQILCPVKTAQQ